VRTYLADISDDKDELLEKVIVTANSLVEAHDAALAHGRSKWEGFCGGGDFVRVSGVGERSETVISAISLTPPIIRGRPTSR
jgi:hypothetical protein